MSEIRCRDSNGTYYLSPGNRIVSIPLIGATSATITPGSTTPISPTYTYISKIVKGVNSNYYFSNISSGLIRNLYKNKTVYINGVATNLMYRRYTKIYYGFAVGKGGSTGSSSNYMADQRTGGGGGAGGCCLFYFSVASDTTPTFTSSNSNGDYTLTITCDGYTITFTGRHGNNGGNGSGACTGKGGGGGSAGSAEMKLGGTSYTNQQYAGQYGPFYIVAYITSGTAGANGGSWGDRGDAADITVEFNSTLRAALGVTSTIKWSRADGQNGASAAPGVKDSAGNTTWYGSGGGQGGTTKYWSATYSLE